MWLGALNSKLSSGVRESGNLTSQPYLIESSLFKDIVHADDGNRVPRDAELRVLNDFVLGLDVLGLRCADDVGY
jgi:hypothetical protein